MNTKKATKRALLTSVMALVMCVVMLVGTTFAWFTDTASTAVNKIQAGNLDVKLEYKNTPTANFTEVNTSTNVFKDGAFWEPGHVEYVVLKITNAGNLALKYKLGINIAGETGSTNVYGDPFKLSDSIKFAVIDGDKSNLGRDNLVAAATDSKLIKDGYTSVETPLYPAGTEGKDAEKTVTLVVWMPTDVGNEANHKTGAAAPTIDLGIKVDATQYTYEKDSIDDQYDKDAGYLIQVNKDNIQDYLDGKYGSINGMTLVLAAGDYSKLELGRATKYPGSYTDYYIGSISEANKKTYDEFVTIKNNGGWSGSAYYVRNMSNVTIKAAPGAAVTVAGLTGGSGHVYGECYDYVLDKAYTIGSAYYLTQNWSNITIEGITFTAPVDISSSLGTTVIDGVTFKNCAFNINNTASGNQALRYYNENNDGNVKNLTVESCSFNKCFQGVYTQKINGVTVINSSFNTTGHNAIAVQSGSEPVDHKAVVITGNTFEKIGDRIIRFGSVGADTQITIKNNTATNSGDSSGQVMKAQSLAAGVTYDISGNNWGEGKTVGNTELTDR